MQPIAGIRIEFPWRPVTWKRTNRVGGRSITPKEMKEYKKALRGHATLLKPPGWPMLATYVIQGSVWRHRSGTDDYDNHAKMLGDALEGVLWENDRRIYDGRIVKLRDGENPHTVLEVVAFPEDWRPGPPASLLARYGLNP